MSDLSYGDEDRIALDVSLHLAVAAFPAWLEENFPWFVQLDNAHRETRHALTLSGDAESAAVFAEHGPLLNDGVECSSGAHEDGIPYPCAVLRSVHSGQGIWDELVKNYPEGWEEQGWWAW